MGKHGNSTLESYANRTCPVVKGQGNRDQPNITPGRTIFIHNNDDVRERFCQLMTEDGLPFNHFDNP